MKKLCLYLSLLVFVSCTQQEKIIQDENIVKVNSGRLYFKDLESFNKIFQNIQARKIKVENNRLLGLQYKPYADGYISNDILNLSIFDLYGFNIVLNENAEVQIGDRIYFVTGNKTYIKNLNGNIISEHENFDSKTTSNSRALNTPRYIDIGNGYIIASTFRRTHIFIELFYSYMQLQNSSGVPVKAEYFRFDNSLCIDCILGSLPPEYTYNTDHVSYFLGELRSEDYINFGYYLSITDFVKLYNYTDEIRIGDNANL